jgi:hypothetical protein
MLPQETDARKGTMDTESSSSAVHRTDAYRDATEAASAERREIQAEVSRLEARVASLQAREAALEVLTRALRELFSAPTDIAGPYLPFHWTATPSSELQDPDLPHRAASGTR